MCGQGRRHLRFTARPEQVPLTYKKGKEEIMKSWCGLFLLSSGLLISASLGRGQTLPAFGHVMIVPLENNAYSSVVGSSSMPYLNSLISQYGLATQYFPNTHPSIGNYFRLTTGQ